MRYQDTDVPDWLKQTKAYLDEGPHRTVSHDGNMPHGCGNTGQMYDDGSYSFKVDAKSYYGKIGSILMVRRYCLTEDATVVGMIHAYCEYSSMDALNRWIMMHGGIVPREDFVIFPDHSGCYRFLDTFVCFNSFTYKLFNLATKTLHDISEASCFKWGVDYRMAGGFHSPIGYWA